MAAALEETEVSYEDLADLERDFDEVETEILRHQISLSAPLYARRQTTITKIPNFWPLVLEQAPPDIDQYIQPSDSALLLSSLTNLSVTNFEIEDPEGDPRSVSIRWEFAENEYFEDSVLEKKFWYRRGKDGWAGLVSEPVGIKWKEGRDLTGGLLDLVCKAWAARPYPSKKEMTPEEAALKKKIENTGMGGLSFFAWFGFIGRRISKEESELATKTEKERRRERKNGKTSPPEVKDGIDETDDSESMELEIFPDGDDLAVSVTEDLWPGAIKYFTQAQEQDALSDADFESDDEEEELEGEVEGSDDERPSKKQRSS